MIHLTRRYLTDSSNHLKKFIVHVCQLNTNPYNNNLTKFTINVLLQKKFKLQLHIQKKNYQTPKNHLSERNHQKKNSSTNETTTLPPHRIRPK